MNNSNSNMGISNSNKIDDVKCRRKSRIQEIIMAIFGWMYSNIWIIHNMENSNNYYEWCNVI